jgi:hypothetical protein
MRKTLKPAAVFSISMPGDAASDRVSAACRKPPDSKIVVCESQGAPMPISGAEQSFISTFLLDGTAYLSAAKVD